VGLLPVAPDVQQALAEVLAALEAAQVRLAS